VVPVSEPESNRYSSGGLETERIDQLFAEKSHRCRTEDDDALLVQPDDPLIWTKVEQFCQMQIVQMRLVIAP
jgi:hypothetical protein